MSSAESLSYRSPISKLLCFFRRSRDQWKAKCRTAKRENKSLKIRLAKMTQSRDRWKAKAQSSAQHPEAETPPLDAETKNRAQRSSRGPGPRTARLGVGKT